MQAVFALVFPAGGVLLIAGFLKRGTAVSAWEIFLLFMCFFFTPVITLFNVALLRARNKTVHGVHEFTLSDEGVKISGPTFEVLLKWSSIVKVSETKRFLLFFFASSMAHFLPKRVLASKAETQAVWSYIRAHLPAA